MQARTLFYKLMVLSPAIFILGIAVGSRTYDDPYRFTACTPEQNRRILAYGPIAAETALALVGGTDTDTQVLRQTAQKWVDQGANGTLKVLRPICLADTVQHGAKSRAFRPYMLLQLRLIDRAVRDRTDTGDDRTADDLILAIRLCEVMKYCDFTSLAVCSLHQKRAVSALAALDRITDAKRRQVLHSLRKIRDQQAPLEGMVARVRVNEAKERVAAGKELLSPTKARALFSTILAPVRVEQSSLAEDKDYPGAVNMIRIGCAAHVAFQHALHAAETTIAGAAP
jgi:hypothetical protein